MNLREIKKDIDYLFGAFVEDCSICATVNPDLYDKAIAAIMEEGIAQYNELKDKVSAKVEGSKKQYFTELRKELLTKIDALYDKLSESVKNKAEEEVPAEEKPAPKKAAAKKAPAKKADEAPAEEAPAKKKPAAKKAPAKKKVEETPAE